jgi:hypothetical protein
VALSAVPVTQTVGRLLKEKVMSKRKPHNDVIGYVCEIQNRVTGVGHVVIYDRNKGFDCGADGRYVVVCETHGTMVSETALPRARMSMKSVEFCQECHAQQSVHPTRAGMGSKSNIRFATLAGNANR